ncbi:UDP-N-acetylmuramoyl-tripeptide--D-alanyl-D-alanine ligase [Aquisalinus flavus]|uniref:UDP-N-acetylmuramoyl-tripeptide--D-alanyl-D-alanine ligase n=1 Tax=Aquisalinus flavus TaxID=1526572 RepID=A0A8J2Y692_9PROT|nr:UDP-N-acetylmuramoyl-tripeptide--D-alanyl-D-alanine ligase [Aquisalinus flavus]MBD0427291.1 UDP-N-acetylmuramoyl-tripeptide--D-alanyl-D-alanine ligase [Aquisalinus flavus]UNE47101.1 UDP-N-acetylmuramoyl-tripeptide--D-alanyl-D-alanine ligase [Aquisalinus flavus]GGC99823.1 UDP-N-acetylmuramoyl-tripeptide--D-alanyl-D-alanine ligase [Aquisalinus flavus]
MSTLWNAYEAAAATGGALCARGDLGGNDEILPEESWIASGLSIDTRTIRKGDIFVALKAARDGHDFVRNAFKAGASAALVSRAPEDTPDGAPLLLVQDTQKGLEALAAAARDRCFGKLIGVTGSAGKTSTKEMLRTMLMGQGKVHAAEKSYNNHWGVPLTLAALQPDTDFGVFEIGMNHAGEITPLTSLVRPHVAIVTTVAAAHLEFFDSVAGIAEAKAEIILGLRKGGTAVLPLDNEHFAILAKQVSDINQYGREIKTITFGRAEGADLRMLDYTATTQGRGTITAAIFGERRSFTIGLAGEHQAMNALAALGAVKAAGGDLALAMEAIAGHRPVGGRGKPLDLKLDGKSVTLLDESYNANPASMAAAIHVLASWQGAQKIAVLGEMRELGDNGPMLHAGLGPLLAKAGVTRVFAAGTLMKPMFDGLPGAMQGKWAETAADLVDNVAADAEDGAVIMAKGSNASRVSAFVEALTERAGGVHQE